MGVHVATSLADALAVMYCVSRATIRRDAELTHAVDTLAANCGPGVPALVLSQEIGQAGYLSLPAGRKLTPAVTANAPTVFPTADYLKAARNYFPFKTQEELTAWNSLFLPITQGT